MTKRSAQIKNSDRHDRKSYELKMDVHGKGKLEQRFKCNLTVKVQKVVVSSSISRGRVGSEIRFHDDFLLSGDPLKLF